jgi:hypothetical protein
MPKRRKMMICSAQEVSAATLAKRVLDLWVECDPANGVRFENVIDETRFVVASCRSEYEAEKGELILEIAQRMRKALVTGARPKVDAQGDAWLGLLLHLSEDAGPGVALDN